MILLMILSKTDGNQVFTRCTPDFLDDLLISPDNSGDNLDFHVSGFFYEEAGVLGK